jgi:hypothetical protein
MRHLALMAAALLLAAGSAAAEHVIDQLALPEASCSSPQVAASDHGLTMITFTTNNELTMSFVAAQLVPTHPLTGVPLPPAVTVCSGSGGKLCWSRDGWTLAVADGSVILLYQADQQGQWDTAGPTMLQAGGEVVSLDLWGAPSDAAGPAVFLAYGTSGAPWEEGGRIHLATRSSYYGWSTGELVAEVTEQYPLAQVTWGLGPSGPVPVVYYLDGEPGSPELMWTRRDVEGGWTEPQAVPGDGVSTPSPIGGEFAALHTFTADLARHVLGVGIQPACPCNILNHQVYQSGAGWQAAEEISQNYDYFDWPMSPSLAAGLDGEVHAFWFQQAANYYLEPHLQTLEYWTWDDGQWSHAGEFLAGQNGAGLGSRVALDVSLDGWPVLAWTRTDTIDGEPRREQVWIARPLAPVPVGPDTPPRPEAVLRAWPNPFNPRVELVFDLAQPGPVRLQIHDARGRLVAVLVEGVRAAGPHAAVWEGRDRQGRALPSGVYFARLNVGGARSVRKLVLAR